MESQSYIYAALQNIELRVVLGAMMGGRQMHMCAFGRGADRHARCSIQPDCSSGGRSTFSPGGVAGDTSHSPQCRMLGTYVGT